MAIYNVKKLVYKSLNQRSRYILCRKNLSSYQHQLNNQLNTLSHDFRTTLYISINISIIQIEKTLSELPLKWKWLIKWSSKIFLLNIRILFERFCQHWAVFAFRVMVPPAIAFKQFASTVQLRQLPRKWSRKTVENVLSLGWIYAEVIYPLFI